MHNVRERERELEIVDQTQTQRYVSRFEHLALRPRLHTEGFPLIVHKELPTQGTFTEDLSKYKPGVHNSSLNQYNLSLEVMHNQNKHHLTQEG